MLQLSFVGHQGWWAGGANANLLIDPLLTPAFGHGGLVGRVWPPRVLTLAAMPPLDGVLLTHEHDDHFDLPSLHCIDRRVPVWLSTRASDAAAEALARMGFVDVHRIGGGERLEIGTLSVRTFSPDVQAASSDEWDVLAFVVRDADGHGSVASSVDVPPPAAMLDALATDPPTMWCLANNTAAAPFADALGTTADAHGDAPRIAAAMARRLARLRATTGPTALAWVSGSGWSYDGARAWMNGNAFPTSCAALAAAMQTLCTGTTVEAPVPGDTVTLRQGAVVQRRAETPWLHTRPKATWPARAYVGDVAAMPTYAPACGRHTLRPSQRAALAEGLDDLARALYGHLLFRQLHAMPNATVGIALKEGRDGAIGSVLQYRPSACRFVPVECDTDPIQAFDSGLECWASDLAALVQGEIGASALCYAGRMRYWNRQPARLRIGPDVVLRWAHPLRRPHAARGLYGAQIAALPATPPSIRARR